MKDYDSDSSEDEQAAYTETSTLLGYVSEQPTGDCTKLGGLPSWIDDKTAPSGQLSNCKVCNGYLALLLQVNGDLPDRFPGHERRLYVFICRNKACRRKNGSVRSIRGSKVAKSASSSSNKAANKAEPAESQQAVKPAIDIGATLFGAKPTAASFSAPKNPFSSNKSANGGSHNPFSSPSKDLSTPSAAIQSLPDTFASKIRTSSPPATTPAATSPPRPLEPWPSLDALPPPYPEFFLEAEYETLSAPATPQVTKSIAEIDMTGDGSSSASGGGSGQEDKDLFESTMDKTFQRFADRTAANPEQCIRYEYGGVPLLYSDADEVGALLSDAQKRSTNSLAAKITVQSQTQGSSRMPRCGACGGPRVFEVQMMPHAIAELEADEVGVDGMEWGTIVVGVCAADCALAAVGEVGYAEEWCGVQYEELVGKKR